MSLEVLTEEGFRKLIDHKATQIFDGNGFKFITAHVGVSSGNLSDFPILEIELKYEQPRSRATEFLARSLNNLGHHFWGLDIGPVFSTKVVIYMHNNSTQITGFEGDEDYRYMLFGSRSLYKAFLSVLSEAKRNGLITDKEYLEVINRVDDRFSITYCEWRNAPFFYKKQTLREFREVFESDPLISPYLRRAKEIV